ncbi:MAG: DNA-protecting protein DprA [Erysipelotrichaceae bacterium]|nr:DNA-protecting protein DprA [Erysipelotrichaceae bacterium]
MELKERIVQYSYLFNGDWHQISKALKDDLPITEPFFIADNFITLFDEEYPQSLKELRYPPWVLYYKGDISLLKREMVAVVGSRKMIPYGAWMTRAIVNHLPKRYGIVSGMARGVDALAHETAIAGGHFTIGVIGSGLDIQYPKENKDLYERMKDQLIISEYPHFTGVKKHHFPWRNRIIAALAKKVIVTQATYKSGTMLTVNEAITLGKEIWCVPYPFNEEAGRGCNLLIQQGAQLLQTFEDICT